LNTQRDEQKEKKKELDKREKTLEKEEQAVESQIRSSPSGWGSKRWPRLLYGITVEYGNCHWASGSASICP